MSQNSKNKYAQWALLTQTYAPEWWSRVWVMVDGGVSKKPLPIWIQLNSSLAFYISRDVTFLCRDIKITVV